MGPHDRITLEIIREESLVEPSELDEAIAAFESKGPSARLDAHLLESGLLSPEHLLRVLALRNERSQAAGLELPPPPVEPEESAVEEELEEPGDDGDGEELGRLGPFELREEVGKGASGVVYRARDPELEREVALKVLHRNTSDRGRLLERFRREAEVTIELDHPHIVSVHRVGDYRGKVHYIVMDLVEGGAMTTELAAHSWERRKALGLLRDTALALDYAHDRGVVHRDVKPRNILIDRDERARLTDFGLAKISLASALTRTGEVIGTPRYMAPEQVSGESREVDGRCDVYALGVILYRKLTGEVPYEAETLVELYRAILQGDIVPAREVRPDLSPALAAIVEKAMARDPDDRYPSAAAFAEDVDRFLEGGDEPRAAQRTVSDVGRALRRAGTSAVGRRVGIVVGAVIAAILSGMGLMALFTDDPEPTSPADSGDPEPPSLEDPPPGTADAPRTPDPLGRRVARAREILAGGSPGDVASLVGSLREEAPSDPRVLVVRAELALARGDPSEAWDLLDRAVRNPALEGSIAADALLTRARLALLRLADGPATEAIDRASRILGASHPRILRARALQAERTGDEERALRLWAEAAEAEDPEGIARAGLVRARIRAGRDLSRALAEISILERLGHPRARILRGWAYHTQGDEPGALAAFLRARDAHPDDPEVLAGQAAALLGLARERPDDGDAPPHERVVAEELVDRVDRLMSRGAGPAAARIHLDRSREALARWLRTRQDADHREALEHARRARRVTPWWPAVDRLLDRIREVAPDDDRG